MTAGEYGTGYADRLGNSAWRWIALFLARSAGGQCVRWCGYSRSCPSPARFRSCGERGRIASGTPPCLPRWGRWHGVSRDGEGLFPTAHTIPRCCPLSRLRRQLSQRESQVGCVSFVGAFWFGAYVSGGFAVPHPSRLAASHLPPGEGFLRRWNSVGAEDNPRWRRGHTHERYVSFPQLIEP